MTPAELGTYLDALIEHELKLSLMIWGPAGVGKSSVVSQVAGRNDLRVIDLRLSQLAPTDLRGLPVPSGGVSRWLPPEFLPTEGRGVLFLDEVNMAPPALQGIAQQLILDRRVGSYVLPEGWFIWAAGNRKEDRAAVFDMPAPLANRFVHLEVAPDFESFRAYAVRAGLEEQILAFLSFRPGLLHHLDVERPAWPSPRTWEMASRLHGAGLDVGPAVGEGAGAEFHAFLGLYADMPDLDKILAGEGASEAFPTEPSGRYAAVVGLALHADDAEKAREGFEWMLSAAGSEWVQLYASNVVLNLQAAGRLGALAQLLRDHADFQRFFQEYQALLSA